MRTRSGVSDEPVEGRIASADAGLLCRPIALTFLERGGDYLGLVKENQPKLKQSPDEWIEKDRFPLGQKPPDDTWVDTGHGRVECRELWLVDSQEMASYLHDVLDWLGVQHSGPLRRSRRRLGQTDRQTRDAITLVGGMSPGRLS